MADITTIWDIANSQGDWAINGPDLQSGSDLQTAVIISIFTDRQANPDDVIPDGSTDRRGWCLDDPQYPIGSRLWLLTRSKLTAQVAALAQAYIAEALQWMIDDGVVANFNIFTQLTPPNMLGIAVQLLKQDGNSVAMNFNWAWGETQ